MKKRLNFEDDVAEKLHGKLIPTKEAIKLLKAMVISDDPAPGNPVCGDRNCIVLFESLCPTSEKTSSSMAEVCICAGEPYASRAINDNLGKSRRINEEEAIRILETKNAKGHVHYIYFKECESGKFYAICNCCQDCCATVGSEHGKGPKLIPAGYIAVVDPNKCIGCGQCMEYCPFGAMNLRDKRMRINPRKCMGCGVCTNKCRKEALRLARNKKHPAPLQEDKLKNK